MSRHGGDNQGAESDWAVGHHAFAHSDAQGNGEGAALPGVLASLWWEIRAVRAGGAGGHGAGGQTLHPRFGRGGDAHSGLASIHLCVVLVAAYWLRRIALTQIKASLEMIVTRARRQGVALSYAVDMVDGVAEDQIMDLIHARSGLTV